LTLTMTIVAPWGVWQCSDHRVTYLVPKPNQRWKVVKREDDSVKHVQLVCKDGSALLTYSGLAKVGNDHISDWLRRLVRGQSRTVDETLIRIREEATATLAGPAAKNDIAHALVIGAFVQGKPWIVAIVNQKLPDSPPLDHFETDGFALQEPMALIVGEGRKAVSDADWALAQRVAKRRPKRPEDYSRVLADVHRRAKHSNHPARHTISEACITSYMPPAGHGIQSVRHWGQRDPSRKWPILVPMVVSGIDATEIMKATVENMEAREGGQPVDDAENQRRIGEAGRRAVEPLKPRRPR
jgi:hypothetical protein